MDSKIHPSTPLDEEKNLSHTIKEADLDADAGAIDIVHASETEYTEDQYRRLLRKINWTILPLMWIAYGLQQADKKSTSTQATFGLKTDTGLVGQQYSWLSTIFYIAYLVGEFPGNFLLQRYHVGRLLGSFMFVWGLVVLCIAFAKNFAHLMVLRTIQGIAECTISPSFLILTGAWYKTSEHAWVAVIWGTANSGFGMIADLICYGIGRAAQKAGDIDTAWTYISYFFGGLTILVSIPVFFVLGTPSQVSWLSPEQRRMALARIVDGQTGSDRGRVPFNRVHAKEALIDPQTWFLFVAVFVGSLPNGGVTTFINIVFKSFGFSSLDSILIGTLPHDGVGIIYFLIVGYINMKKKGLRFYFMLFSLIPGFVGLLVMGLLPFEDRYRWPKWACFMISVTANVVGLMCWTFVPSNVAGRTKRTVTQGMLFAAYCAGNAVGAQIFQASDSPLYHRALIVCATMYAVEFFVIIGWRMWYVYQNKRRDRMVAEMGMTKEESEHQGKLNAEADMSDWTNIHFRYTI
ncbi:hypothetical protein IAT38_007281 [Cryptococcus sp. DSM 104549]